MTLDSTLPRAYTSGGQVSGEYTVPFMFFADSDLAVYVETDGVLAQKTLGVHYNVSGALDPDGGTITFTAGNLPTADENVLIVSETTVNQETVYTTGGAFSSVSHERAIDKLTRIAQELTLIKQRSIRLPLTEDDELGELPVAELRAGMFLYFNEDTGEPEMADADAIVEGAIATTAANVAAAQAAEVDAIARAAAALVSQNAAAASAAAAESYAEQAQAIAGAEHNALTSRDAADCHPSSAITDLAPTGGDAGKMLFVKADETGYELKAPDAARTALGLGTAAVANTGTASGDVPVLDANGRLAASTTPLLRTSALTYAATVTPNLAKAEAFTLTLTGAANLGDMTLPGPGWWPIEVTGEYALSTHVNWAIDDDGEAADTGTGTRVFWAYSLDGTDKRLFIKPQEDA